MASIDYNTQSTTTEQSHDKVSKLVDPNQDPETTRDIFDEWAQNYEVDASKVNYINWATLAAYIASSGLVDKSAKILDVGAGTGLHGLELEKAGYAQLDAVEPSSAMMEQAKARGLYQRHIIDFVGANRLDINDETYDVVTGAGCFVPSHINVDAFEELYRVLKPGGYFFLAVSERYYEEKYEGYGQKMEQRVKDYIEKGLWTQINRDMIPYLAHYKCYVTVLKKKQ